jgi:hypothetical protein
MAIWLPIDALSAVLRDFPLCYLVHLKRVSKAWANAVRRVAAHPGRAAEIARVPARFATYDSHTAAYASFIKNASDKPRKRHVGTLLRKLQKLDNPHRRATYLRCNDLLFNVFRQDSIFTKYVYSYVEGGSNRVFIYCDQYGIEHDSMNALALRLVQAGFNVHAFAKKYTGPDESAPGYSGGHYRWSVVGFLFDD